MVKVQHVMYAGDQNNALIHNFLRKEVEKSIMHFCFFKSHQLISGSDRTEVHLAKESRKSTIFDRELVSRSLKKTGVFFQTKFNFGHECPQYFIAYKNLNTPKLFLFLHFLILDFHNQLFTFQSLVKSTGNLVDPFTFTLLEKKRGFWKDE